MKKFYDQIIIILCIALVIIEQFLDIKGIVLIHNTIFIQLFLALLTGILILINYKNILIFLGWIFVVCSFILDILKSELIYTEEWIFHWHIILLSIGLLFVSYGLLQLFNENKYYDDITKLKNRRGYEENLKKIDKESNLPIGVIICDINALKIINDTYGFEKGDQILLVFSNILKKNCNKKTIYRIGSDKFILLMFNTNIESITDKINKIKIECGKLKNVDISISIGGHLKMKKEEKLSEVITAADNKMYRNKLLHRNSLRTSLITSLMKSLEEKSYETTAHVSRVEEYALKIGEKIGLLNSEIDNLCLLGYLHDIGKIAIPESIIMKPGTLNDDEWDIIKNHSKIGSRIIEGIPYLQPIAKSILSHHERWDGKGYPNGIKAKEIPLISRIISIVDTFDVIINGRPYKKPLSNEEALAEIKRCSGTQFDPELVNIFEEIIVNEPFGN